MLILNSLSYPLTYPYLTLCTVEILIWQTLCTIWWVEPACPTDVHWQLFVIIPQLSMAINRPACPLAIEWQDIAIKTKTTDQFIHNFSCMAVFIMCCIHACSMRFSKFKIFLYLCCICTICSQLWHFIMLIVFDNGENLKLTFFCK